MSTQVKAGGPARPAVTRRGVLTVAGAITLLALDGPTLRGDDPKRVERTYEGAAGKLQDALDRALTLLDKDLPEGIVADAQGSWKLVEVTGTRGGFAGPRKVKVKITATRNPDWKK